LLLLGAQLIDGALGMAYGVLTQRRFAVHGICVGPSERTRSQGGNLHHRGVGGTHVYHRYPDRPFVRL
jgi:hypothetical protein